MSTFVDRAMALQAQGYRVVPIKQGVKGPQIDGWQELRATPAMIEGWGRNGYANGNVGIITEDTPAVDIDIYDAEVADAMESWMLKEFGVDLMVRVGQAPKRLMMFRTRQPFKKMVCTYMAGSQRHQVEVLAHGQQFVAYGIHPDTKQPYTWTSIDEPVYVKSSLLPELTEGDIGLIFDKFEALAKAHGWTRKHRTDTLRTNDDNGDTALERYKPVVALTVDQVREHLAYVPNDNADYDRYLDIGFALHHQFAGDNTGLELWHEWARSSDKYDPADIAHRWPSMGHGPATKTFATVVYWADQARKQEAKNDWNKTLNRIELAADTDILYNEIIPSLAKMTLEDTEVDQALARIQMRLKELTGVKPRLASINKRLLAARPKRVVTKSEHPSWVRHWIYVQSEGVFFNTHTGKSLSSRSFDATYGRELLSDEDRATGNAFNGKASDTALNLYAIPTVYGRMYLPGNDQVVTVQGLDYVNTYSERHVPAPKTPNCAEDFKAIKTVERHFEILFPVAFERNIVLDYLAFTVQFPAEKINWALLIQGVDGAGKSWMADMMSAVMGGSHTTSVPGDSLKEKYTKFAEGKKLVFIEEVRMHGTNKYEIIDRMKPLVTNRSISIRKMGTDLYEIINVTNYIMFTNYDDALPIDRNDRRYAVLRTAFLTKGNLQRFKDENPDYFERLFEVLTWNIDVIRDWLLKRQISPDFEEKGHAPDTEAKDLMRETHEGTDDLDRLQQMIDEGDDPEVSDNVLNPGKLRAGGNIILDGRSFGHFLKQAGFVKIGKLRVHGRGGENITWYTRNENLFNGLSGSAKVRKILELIGEKKLDDGFGDET